MRKPYVLLNCFSVGSTVLNLCNNNVISVSSFISSFGSSDVKLIFINLLLLSKYKVGLFFISVYNSVILHFLLRIKLISFLLRSSLGFNKPFDS